MAIQESYTLQLVCEAEGCNRNRMWGGQLYANGGGVREVRDEARRAGWVMQFKPKERCYCPEHAHMINQTKDL